MNDKIYFFQFIRSSITWLEKYIEVAKYYPDWKQRKQTDDSFITRKDIYESKSKVLWPLGTSLMIGFEGDLDEQPLEFREEIKKEFYKWLDTSKINVDNAPVELKCALFHFHEILECRFEKARHDRDNRKREIEIDDPKYLEKMQGIFGKSQQVIQSGKTDEIDGSRFNGNAKAGKTTFEAIANSLSDSEKENFSFWLQKNSEKQEIKENQDNKEQETKTTKPAPEKEHPKTTKTILIIGSIFLAGLVLIGLILYYWKKNKKAEN
ncbi:hypothetical protein [endosymbiont GvMRE of Glomus versiforme]|uniref:hypothetical protein n=1 Tax=endosymbiont GvMRE of Glomus versiforme TaxID=2039283 RepID=UPI000EE23946|nr:hypothetical protein [endosymbiont GvMRE of Glomus versiforme]RHZ37697.1 hypothetical protein GvMRE_I1g239 [endosymbiont GvMRE of Glomus versiforme]